MSNFSNSSEAEDADDIHENLPDGSGCAEIWEHLSNLRDERENDV